MRDAPANTGIGYRKFGGPERLEDVAVAYPRLSKKTVIVDVKAIGLNPLDYRLRRGEMIPVIWGPHRITASDYAGVVSAVGPGVNDISVGDSVYGMLNQLFEGSARDSIRVSREHVAKKPKNLEMEAAAAIPLAAMTAYQALHELAQIQRGHRVCINGASGGVGTFAIQLARIAGAHVTAVTSFRNSDWMGSLGAEAVIDYTQHDFTQSNQQYDIVFDCYGNRSFSDVQSVLSTRGVYISTIPGIKTYAPMLGNAFRKKRSAVVVVRSRRQHLDSLRALVESEKLKPIVDSIHERVDIADAYKRLETKRSRGKIVVRM